MRYLIAVFLLYASLTMCAQELFVYTEPASNAPAGSIGARIGQSFMKKQVESGNIYSLAPEVTLGISKSLMFRASGYFDNMNNGLDAKGAGLYAKYRFYSVDDIQSHFRMAAFSRYSWNNAVINHENIDLTGLNTGYEAGLVATQLIKKVAISSTVSFRHALSNKDFNFPDGYGANALNYTLSVGRLMYPQKYTNFKQTNINAMLELAGQTITDTGGSYLDVIPAIQFIINSQARIDLAYKKELYSNMDRLASDGVLLKLEYTFFNVF